MNQIATAQSIPPTTKPRILYLDLLRISAFFGVICIHVASLCWYDVTHPDWHIINFYDCVFRCCSSVTFVMISGAIFLNPARTVTIKKAWGKYAARIFRVLLVWGFFYYYIFQAKNQPIDATYLYGFIMRFFSGDLYYHLWFLYMIAGLYIVTPIIRLITTHANQKELLYLIVLAFTCFSLAPYSDIFWPNNLFAIFIDKLQIGIGGGFLLYFITGYYISAYPLKRVARLLIYLAGLIGGSVTIWATYYLSIQAGSGIEIFMDRMTPNVYFAAVAVFLLVKQLLTDKTLPNRLTKAIKVLSDNSFGIYLVHILFVISYRNAGGGARMAQNPLINIPLVALCIFAISFIIIWIIRKIPYIGKKIT